MKPHIIDERATCFVYMKEYELALQELQKLWNLRGTSRSLNSFLPSSYDIITMVPYDGNKKTMATHYEALFTSKKEVHPVKNLKRESQFDKLNRRHEKIANKKRDNMRLKEKKIVAQKEIQSINEYKSIKALVFEGKEDLALIALEEFFEKYGKSTNDAVIALYAALIRQLESPNAALEILNDCSSNSHHILRERTLCYFYNEEYAKAFTMFQNFPFLDRTDKVIKSFCCAKL